MSLDALLYKIFKTGYRHPNPLPPAQLKELKIAPLSDAFFLDEYEKRESPRRVTYFWLSDGLQMEPHAPGTDLDLLEKGHVTLSIVTGFRDETDWLEEKHPGTK